MLKKLSVFVFALALSFSLQAKWGFFLMPQANECWRYVYTADGMEKARGVTYLCIPADWYKFCTPTDCEIMVLTI